MDIISEKLILLFGMLIITLISSLVPRWLGPRMKMANVLDYCHCISGGVFIGALFLDLIPETKEAFESVNVWNDSKLPLPELVICLGFFLPFFIEHSVLLCIKKSRVIR